MFISVHKKLERAGYFLNNLKTLAEDAGGFPYIKKQQEMRANLDGFFFEVVSAKDFFLQGINDEYGLGLSRRKATYIDKLIGKLKLPKQNYVKNVLDEIKELLDETKLQPQQKLQDDEKSWLWRLNNYRNSATHRELLSLGHEVEYPPITVDKSLFDKIKKGEVVTKLITEEQAKAIPPDVPRVYTSRENIKTYLFKDPEDSSQGNTDIEVIPYCEQSLKQMREFLENLYSKLGI